MDDNFLTDRGALIYVCLGNFFCSFSQRNWHMNIFFKQYFWSKMFNLATDNTHEKTFLPFFFANSNCTVCPKSLVIFKVYSIYGQCLMEIMYTDRTAWIIVHFHWGKMTVRDITHIFPVSPLLTVVLCWVFRSNLHPNWILPQN